MDVVALGRGKIAATVIDQTIMLHSHGEEGGCDPLIFQH
jgi:hypothetical protein